MVTTIKKTTPSLFDDSVSGGVPRCLRSIEAWRGYIGNILFLPCCENGTSRIAKVSQNGRTCRKLVEFSGLDGWIVGSYLDNLFKRKRKLDCTLTIDVIHHDKD